MKINKWIILLGAFAFQVLSWFDIRSTVAAFLKIDPFITPVQAGLGAAALALFVVFASIEIAEKRG